MNNLKKQIIGHPTLAAFALLLSASLLGSCGEEKDDFDSRLACRDYCDKKFDCEDHSATDSETDACVSACRDSIEDKCGNDNQAEANDKINDCVDLACVEFWPCMVFDPAPECYGFVGL